MAGNDAAGGLRSAPGAWPARLLGLCGVALMLFLVLLVLVARGSPPNARAVLHMAFALAVLWIGVGGMLMVALRKPARAWAQRLALPRPLLFVLFATLLALVEEAITVGLTNAAPWFGAAYGAAYITASGNYADVVLRHSVVVFVPMFIVWGFVLRKWDFAPATVLLLFGLTGVASEALFGGAQALLQAPMWIFVYGLLVWLPAYTLVPLQERAVRPPWWALPLAVALPLLGAMPVALLLAWLHPVPIHFSPIIN